MSACLPHRGPDDAGVWVSADGTIALAHRRLAIVDLSPRGHNPMMWDGGRLWITYNGEIYNFLELRKELEGFGHRFQSGTDTEVILAAYDRWGTDCVHRFVGMFAFALWDQPKQRLWVVRDRLGKKPLYFADVNGVFRFASELKALVADEAFPRDVDPDAVALYLHLGYVPSPRTIYRHAQKLPPAHFLICEQGRVTITRYWNPIAFSEGQVPRRSLDAERELDALLSKAVSQRMIADVPLGAFLSGGIDSSLVVALMQEHSDRPVRTFTIRFENPQYDEADHAAAVARHLGTEHHEHTCDDREMLAVVDRLPSLYDEPFADSSAVPTYLVSRTARDLVTVALSGDGGDELFFGYPRYRFYPLAIAGLSLPGPIRGAAAVAAGHLPGRRLQRMADVLSGDPGDCYSGFVAWWTRAEIETLTNRRPTKVPGYADVLERGNRVPRSDHPGLFDLVSYLPEDILTKVDRASMAVSLEVRAPLLDHRVVEFALGLPVGLKRRRGTTKWILRQLLYKRVPPALVDRPKMGFSVPLDDWFRGPLREQMASYCGGADLEDLGINPTPVRTLWADFLARRTHRTDLLWQMFSLVAWSRHSRASSRPPAR